MGVLYHFWFAFLMPFTVLAIFAWLVCEQTRVGRTRKQTASLHSACYFTIL